MGRRRKSRECALQILFQADVVHDTPDCGAFFENDPAPLLIRNFAVHLVEGYRTNAAQIDGIIESSAKNWPVERMGAVERNVLRIGAYELIHDLATPPRVVMDEAIELARKFGSDESSAFVNGVLDAIHRAVAREPGEGKAPS